MLPEIELAIAECDFIAIDGEFTGLHNGTMVSIFDTAAQYYQKLRSNCMDFLMVQFGLCAVKYNAENKKYNITRSLRILSKFNKILCVFILGIHTGRIIFIPFQSP